MATKKTTKKRTTTKPKPKLKVTKVDKLTSSPVKITYLKKAEKFSAARKLDTIHVRKFLPETKSGAKVNDLMPTVAMALDQDLDITILRKRGRGPVPMAASDTVTFKKNVQIADIATADETDTHGDSRCPMANPRQAHVPGWQSGDVPEPAARLEVRQTASEDVGSWRTLPG